VNRSTRDGPTDLGVWHYGVGLLSCAVLNDHTTLLVSGRYSFAFVFIVRFDRAFAFQEVHVKIS
jgi:hypothetical protein